MFWGIKVIIYVIMVWKGFGYSAAEVFNLDVYHSAASSLLLFSLMYYFILDIS